MLKKLLGTSVLYSLGPTLPKVVNLFMLPIITPFLTEEDYGINGLVMGYIGAVTALKDLGLLVVISNTFYKYRNRYLWVWQRLYGFLVVWSLLLAVLVAGLLYTALPGPAKGQFPIIALLFCVPIAFFDATVLFGSRYFHLSQRPKPFTLITVVASLSTVAINYITIVELKMGYMGWFIASAGSVFIKFVPYFYVLWFRHRIRPNFGFNKRWIKKHLAIALPTVPHFYSGYLLDMSDKVLLDWFAVGLKQLGLYSLAYTMGSYFAIVSRSLALAVGPMYLEQYAKNTPEGFRKARNMTMGLQLGVLSLAFLIAIWMREGFQLLIRNENLQDAYLISTVIIMSYGFKPMYFAPVMRINFMEKTNKLWHISFIAGAINVALNLVLIPTIGIWGAAISTFMAMIYLNFSGYTLKVFRQVNEEKYYPALWLVITVALSAFAYVAVDFDYPIKIGISLAILAALAYTVKRLRHVVGF